MSFRIFCLSAGKPKSLFPSKDCSDHWCGGRWSPLSSSDLCFPHPTVNPPWWLFQVTYLPFTVFTIGLLLCSEVFLPRQLPVMGSLLQLSKCTELGVQKSKFGFYETFGVGDALKPPRVFRIFDYLFPVAFEIYVTPTSSQSP